MNYQDFITKNTSYLTKTITTEAHNFTILLAAILFMTSEVFVVLLIYGTLLFEDFSKEEIENFHREIAKNIATIRKEKGFSQLDLSLAIGYKSVSLVGGAEAGYKNIHYNLEHLYKIAKVLEVEIGDFFKGI